MLSALFDDFVFLIIIKTINPFGQRFYDGSLMGGTVAKTDEHRVRERSCKVGRWSASTEEAATSYLLKDSERR